MHPAPAFDADAEMARLREAAAAVDAARAASGAAASRPRVALVLGSGLGGLADEIDVEVAVAYADLPHFPACTVQGHRGRLVLGRLEGAPVVAMQGRLHRYEGFPMHRIAFPVRVMRLLGADALVVTASCGGMNPLHAPGDLIALDDHVNLMGDSPLIGPNLDELGPRFPDMSAPYDRELRQMAEAAAIAHRIPLRRGVHVAVPGPQLETRAEYRMLRRMGADVVGMSIVPEVIAARHMAMRVLAVCVITDACLPDALEEVDAEAIVAAAEKAAPKLSRVVRGVLRGVAGEAPGPRGAGLAEAPAT